MKLTVNNHESLLMTWLDFSKAEVKVKAGYRGGKRWRWGTKVHLLVKAYGHFSSMTLGPKWHGCCGSELSWHFFGIGAKVSKDNSDLSAKMSRHISVLCCLWKNLSSTTLYRNKLIYCQKCFFCRFINLFTYITLVTASGDTIRHIISNIAILKTYRIVSILR